MITFRANTFAANTFHTDTFGGLGEPLEGPFELQTFVFIIPGVVAWTLES